ncbi:MAG: hypothetical protein TYPL_2220 [Candidatus Tyloplasma litorale]|nr:MAG: hypothetical protein TYPL_2220 [Mycoplasmatales bacterium]
MKNKKNRLIKILVLMLFIFSILLSANLFFLQFNRNNDENDSLDLIDLLPNNEKIYMNWPYISENKLSKSIIDYEGNIDFYLFQTIFEEELYSKFEYNTKWLTIEYEKELNVIYVYVKYGLKIYDGKIILNNTHIYKFTLINNNV